MINLKSLFHKYNFKSSEKTDTNKFDHNIHDSVEIVNSKFGHGRINIGASCIMNNAHLCGNIQIDDNCKFYGPIEISADSEVKIGRSSSLNGPGLNINAKINPVTIGKFCSIASKTTIHEYNHHIQSASTYFMQKHYNNKKMHEDIESKGAIEIGNDVWIGSGSYILSGAKIADGCIIGANTVVTGKIEPYSIVAGNPGKTIKKRFSEDLIQLLLRLEWWNWSNEQIQHNIDFFTGELNHSKFNNLDLK